MSAEVHPSAFLDILIVRTRRTIWNFALLKVTNPKRKQAQFSNRILDFRFNSLDTISKDPNSLGNVCREGVERTFGPTLRRCDSI